MSRSSDQAPRRELVAILGGTFDPPHIGHVRVAEEVRDRLEPSAVWLAPAAAPAHRGAPVLPAADRLRLVRAAVAGRERLGACGIELEREGPSFTIDTLDRLAAGTAGPAEARPHFAWIIGSDAFREIRSWRRWETLLARHPVVIVSRRGFPLRDALAPLPGPLRRRATKDLTSSPAPPRIFLLDLDIEGPQARRIRERIAAGRAITGLVAPAVEAAIAAGGFYR